MDISIGRMVSCMPINHPLMDKVMRRGGIPHAHIEKYNEAALEVSSPGEIMPINKSNRGSRMIITNSPNIAARETDRQNIILVAPFFWEPKASAVSPVVPILKKPQSHNITLNIVPPAATAAK